MKRENIFSYIQATCEACHSFLESFSIPVGKQSVVFLEKKRLYTTSMYLGWAGKGRCLCAVVVKGDVVSVV